jgi:ribosomal protein S18 acetylase RimI-like enzyme
MTDRASEIRIRAGRADDADVIAEFNARLARETESLELDRVTVLAGVRAALADASKGRYFVATDGTGRVVGQLMLTREWSDWRNADIWWIMSVYVDAEFRGLGVFKSLYRHVEALAREEGAAALRLYVEKENAAAQRTYAKLGMSKTHYLLMEATLNPRTP